MIISESRYSSASSSSIASLAGQFGWFLVDVILHVAMEALLWGIVPTVSSTGHGLTQLLILQDVDEAIAGVVAPLVTIDYRLGVKRDSVILYKQVYGFQYKVNL